MECILRVGGRCDICIKCMSNICRRDWPTWKGSVSLTWLKQPSPQWRASVVRCTTCLVTVFVKSTSTTGSCWRSMESRVSTLLSAKMTWNTICNYTWKHVKYWYKNWHCHLTKLDMHFIFTEDSFLIF